MTAGSDRLDYPGNPSSPEISIIGVKFHINSIIFDAHKVAQYMGIDIKNLYLGNPMKNYQYLRVRCTLIPYEVMDKYQFTVKTDGHV